jgi:regulator of protease activity HflC (stomatin/prohibitin superfamily)
MPTISNYPLVSHLRAEPSQHILHFSGGRLVKQGPGIAYWFLPLSAAVAQVPVEDIEVTLVLNEYSVDFQEVSVQVTVRYRCADPETVAKRVNFGVNLKTGVWSEAPIERLATFWSQRAQQPVRALINRVPVEEAVRGAADAVATAIDAALRADAEITAMGLQVVGVQVTRIAPNAEVERALQVPTREAIQQKSDEATFSRRALAVEKERAIKENELNNQIELARKEQLLISQNGNNELTRVKQAAEAEDARLGAELARNALSARSYAETVVTRGDGDTSARRAWEEMQNAGEARRVELYKNAPAAVGVAMSIQQLASKVHTIQHLNITPELFGSLFEDLLKDRGAAPTKK